MTGVPLTKVAYLNLCVILGRSLDHRRPKVSPLGSDCEWPIGIYLLGHRDPATNAFMVDYVGSAIRNSTDISDRIEEHPVEKAKGERFTSQVILPLRKDTPTAEVRRLEGVIARALDVPQWCKLVPGGKKK